MRSAGRAWTIKECRWHLVSTLPY